MRAVDERRIILSTPSRRRHAIIFATAASFLSIFFFPRDLLQFSTSRHLLLFIDDTVAHQDLPVAEEKRGRNFFFSSLTDGHRHGRGGCRRLTPRRTILIVDGTYFSFSTLTNAEANHLRRHRSFLPSTNRLESSNASPDPRSSSHHQDNLWRRRRRRE